MSICMICDCKLERWFDGEEEDLYCDRCWRWQKQIDELKARVVELEKPQIVLEHTPLKECNCGCGYVYSPGEVRDHP